MSSEEQTIANVFKESGMLQGVLENGTMAHSGLTILWRGFDTFYGFTEGHWGDYFNPPMQHNTTFEEGEGISRMTSQQKQSNF